MNKQNLIDYFSVGIKNYRFNSSIPFIGAEIETHFVDNNGKAITQECSQQILLSLTEKQWCITRFKDNIITELSSQAGYIRYELGRQNLELSTVPYYGARDLLESIKSSLEKLYEVAKKCGAYPLFSPIINSDDDLLIIPDKRDASWLKLDGKKALNLLAKTASVQFTIGARSHRHGIKILNKLAKEKNQRRLTLMNPYVQETIWKEYIKTSDAKYGEDRYGVVSPKNIKEYVNLLSLHDVVSDGKLVPFSEIDSSIDLFLRSVWWKFRLRRYKNNLCVEIRTFARRNDRQITYDLQTLLDIVY